MYMLLEFGLDFNICEFSKLMEIELSYLTVTKSKSDMPFLTFLISGCTHVQIWR